MTKLEPLPQEMRALGVDDFLHHLPVESIQVTDRHGPREYSVPDAAQEATTAPLAAPEAESGVVTPSWAQSASEGHERGNDGLRAVAGPIHATETSSAPMFRQPQGNAPEVTRDMHMDHVHISAGVTFNQPKQIESTDLTLEERVEWLEEEVGRLGRRLQSTIETNHLWDGS